MINVGFENINSKKVFNILSQLEASNSKIVIMSHGFRGSSIGPARTFVDFEKVLVKNNYSVLRFDQPGSGNSDGSYLDSSFNEWVDTIVYFTKKYIKIGYDVALLGQSMGASASVIASARTELDGKIKCLLLWVPDPKSDTNIDPDKIFEEGGQIYKGSFWKQASDSNFYTCLDKFQEGIHLVYGEKDRFISEAWRNKTIEIIKGKNQPYMILKGQDHSPWEYEIAQKVYSEQVNFLKTHL